MSRTSLPPPSPPNVNRWSGGALYDPYEPSHSRSQTVDTVSIPHVSPSPQGTLDKRTSYYAETDDKILKGDEQAPFNATLPPRPHPVKQGTWSKAVKGGFWPRLLYVFFGVIVFAVWVGIVFKFVYMEKKRLDTNAEVDMERYLVSYPKDFMGGDVNIDPREFAMLRASLRGFDPDKKSLSVQWQAAHYNEDDDSFNAVTGRATSIYRDIVSVYNPQDGDNANFSCTGWKLDNSTATVIGLLGLRESDSLDTDIDMMRVEEKASNVWVQPSFGYPWDEWQGSITIMSTLRVDGDPLESYAYVSLSDSIMNWKIWANSTDTWTLQTGCELKVDFYAARPGVVKFTVILAVVVNWITTITVFLLTGESIFLRRAHILEGMDMLGVCFAALFALPTIRILLPGAPSQFGALIDFIGILPNIIIISLCTVLFAAAKVAQRYMDPGSDYKPL